MSSSTAGQDCDALEAAHPAMAVTEQTQTIFDKRKKWLIVIIVSFAATFSTLASNIYFPALPTIASDLDVSIELVNLSVTSYLIFQGLAPSIWGPLSDVHGRRVAYICTLLVFLGACIGLAETRNYATLIVLRCLQSAGSASTVAIGSGVIGDITTRAERGGFMGVYQAGVVVPVAVGPVIGGVIAGTLGWRAIFWFLAIYSGVFLLMLVMVLPETLPSLVGNGGVMPPSSSSTKWLTAFPLSVCKTRTRVVDWDPAVPSSERPPTKRIDVLGPLRILGCKFATPIVVFLAIYYAVWHMSITAMSSLFKERYGLSEMHIGLTFIANGVGSIVGTLVTGKILDVDYRRVKARLQATTTSNTPSSSSPSAGPSSIDIDESFPIEKARLRLVPLFSLLQCLSVLLFGWTIQYPQRVPLAIPIISTFFTGWTVVSTQSVIMTYLIDVFPDRSAAASASLNLARCLCAAGGTSFVMPMINGIGVGWTFTVCAGVQVLALVGVFVQCRFAPRWRFEAQQKKAKH